MPLVLSETDGHLGIATLNNPEKRNCLNAPLIHDFFGVLDQFEASDIRVVILRAQPRAKVWSAGHDVNELPQLVETRFPTVARLGACCDGCKTTQAQSLP